MSSLLDQMLCQDYAEDVAEEYEDVREDYYESISVRVQWNLSAQSLAKC